mmetsp:Transcript_2551/g.5652  ORF Transcript_2551/g.5652 Transcript_2551/m.5652 type:complete len:91 (-) Transcript_2551:227-499(-)
MHIFAGVFGPPGAAPPNRGFAPSIQHAIAIVAAPSLHSTDAACAMPTIKLTDTEVKGNTRIHRSPVDIAEHRRAACIDEARKHRCGSPAR